MRSRVAVIGLLIALMVGAGGAFADGETSIQIRIADRSEIETLTRMVSIDNVDGLVVSAGASPKQLQRLREKGIEFEIVDDGRQPELATMCASGWVDDAARLYDCYPTYAQYTALMQRFADDNPTLVNLESIGSSTNTSRPHELWVVKISDNVGSEENEPEIFLTSSIHGDETTGFVLMLRLIDELTSGYGTDNEITDLVDGNEIWINPAANPDGTYYGSDTDVGSAIRSYTTTSGGYGVDGNRNFPDPNTGPHPDGEVYWAETQAMMAFADAHSFVLSANFHGGAEVLNYPWDTWSRLPADVDWWEDICLDYAGHAQADAAALGDSTYLTTVTSDGVTNGNAWYFIDGGRQDYMNYWHGCREVTIELSYEKLLPASQLVYHWTYNRQALLNFMKETNEGIHGVVTDASTGDPLAATIELVGYDSAADQSWVYTDPDVGDYHRMVLPGTYTVRFTAPGYAALQVAGITVVAGTPTILDAALSPPVLADIGGEVYSAFLDGPLADASVEIVGAAVTTTTGAAGTYSFSAVPTGDYTMRVSGDGHETVEVLRTVAGGSNNFNFALASIGTSMDIDLESDNGGLSGSGSWAWGTPSGTDAPTPHSGTHLWATNLSGEYSSYASDYLDLQGVAVPSAAPELRFWHYFDIEDGTSDWDGGNLKIRAAGSGSYAVITPRGGYTSADINALSEPGFTGTLSGWEEVVVDLSSWAGQSVDLRWHFGSDSSVQQLGWYVDDISFTSVEHAADFDYTSGTLDVDEVVAFVDRTPGAVTAWSWDFGDGESSTLQNPTHAFTSAGNYDVTLIATLAEGDVQITRTVDIGSGGIFDDGFESGDFDVWDGAMP